jgi:hypothetical protein
VFQIKDEVSVVIPMREIYVVEKVENSSGAMPNALLITTKGKMNFIFAHLKARNNILEKISDFLSKQPAVRFVSFSPFPCCLIQPVELDHICDLCCQNESK